MIELWEPVPYEPFGGQYIISNFGRVKPITKSKYSNMKGEYLKHSYGFKGYPCVTLHYLGKSKQCFVHQMVALVFIPNPENKPYVLHMDDNKKNSHVDNLVWGTHADNMRHMVERGRSIKGELVGIAKLDPEKVKKIRSWYATGEVTQMDLAHTYGVNQTIISDVVRRVTWRHI